MYTAEGYAYFVQNPRRINDLLQHHSPEKERPYVVAASVALSNMDYENFLFWKSTVGCAPWASYGAASWCIEKTCGKKGCW